MSFIDGDFSNAVKKSIENKFDTTDVETFALSNWTNRLGPVFHVRQLVPNLYSAELIIGGTNGLQVRQFMDLVRHDPGKWVLHVDIFTYE
jgi:hypothetical protein